MALPFSFYFYLNKFMDIIEILSSIMIPIAFFAGYMYREVKLLSQLATAKTAPNVKLQEADNALAELGVKDVKQLKHETIDDLHYFFTENNTTFVGQGKTLEEAAKHYEKLQGKDMLGWFKHNQQEKNYCFVNGKCLEFHHEQF